jgi:hypothetical protein
MNQPTYPAVIDTFGKLIDHGMGASVACPTCLRAGRPDVRDIDLNRLAGHLGRNWCLINRRWPIKCATCGKRNVEVRITASAPSHPNARARRSRPADRRSDQSTP